MSKTMMVALFCFLWLWCPFLSAQPDTSADCRVMLDSRQQLARDYFEAVTLYRQGDHPAATDELLRTSSETIEETIDELEDVLKSSNSSLGDSCLQAAAMMHSEIEMLYAVKQNWETSKLHHESGLKVVELMSDAEIRERFRRDWLLSLAYFYQTMTVYEGEISSYASAMTHFNEAVERFGGDAEVLIAAGTMYELSGSLLDNDAMKEAEELYRRAIALEPGSAFALVRLGRVLEKRRQYEASETALRKAVRLEVDPISSYMAYLLLGGLAERNGNQEEAIQSYEIAVEMKPKWQVAYMALGHALDQAGRRKKAREVVSAAIEMQADSPEELDGWWAYERGLADRLEPLWSRMRREVAF